MYRKEQCLSLLEDPKSNDESENISLKWHKVISNLLFVLQRHMVKIENLLNEIN